MDSINVHAAKTQFSKLLARVERGEEIVISRSGKPVAKLIPFEKPSLRTLGSMKGLFTVPDDFIAPLPADVQPALKNELSSRSQTAISRVPILERGLWGTQK